MLFNLLAEAATNDGTGTLVIFGVMLVAIVGLFIWSSISNKKKQKEALNMVESLKKGDKVKTIGGICGYVVEIDNDENTFVLETGTDTNKCCIKFDKGAIYKTAPADGQQAKAKEEVKEEPKEEAKN